MGVLELGDFAVGNLPYQLRFRFGSDVKLLVNDLPNPTGAAAAAQILASNQLALPAPADILTSETSSSSSNAAVQQTQGGASRPASAITTTVSNHVLPAPPPIPPPVQILSASSSSLSASSNEIVFIPTGQEVHSTEKKKNNNKKNVENNKIKSPAKTVATARTTVTTTPTKRKGRGLNFIYALKIVQRVKNKSYKYIFSSISNKFIYMYVYK